MDTITLTGVHANGTHGVLAFEHERPQTFVVDVTLHLDLAAAGQSDDLNDTIDYGRVAKDITAVIEGPHVDLIERLAQRIADEILADAPAVASIDVTVHKPHAPIVVAFADVSVSISRVRATDNGRTAEEHAIHNAVVALGGNVGEVESTLRAAVREIDALPGTQVTGISPLYRTAAWGMADGTPDFLNAVVELETTMGSHELLAALQNIEANHGIFYTLFHIMLDVLKRDSKASFFFVGAEDENDELGMATRRFRVYKKFTTSVVSERLFKHYAIENESLYILINKNSCSDCDDLAKRITVAVKKLFSRH